MLTNTELHGVVQGVKLAPVYKTLSLLQMLFVLVTYRCASVLFYLSAILNIATSIKKINALRDKCTYSQI